MKFKVGDKVFFNGGKDKLDPKKGIYTIIKIDDYLHSNIKKYRWGIELGQYFDKSEIVLANTFLIKERLGVK